jgi:hypothetical protein
MNIDLTSPPLPRSLTLSAGIDWVSECVGEVQAKADVEFALVSLLDSEVVKLDGEAATNVPLIRALVSALLERMEDRSTITLMSEGLAQLRSRVAAEPAFVSETRHVLPQGCASRSQSPDFEGASADA